MVRLNEFVRVYDDVLSKESCETLIKIFDDNSDKHERLDQKKKPSFTQFNLTANSADYTDIHNLLIRETLKYRDDYYEFTGDKNLHIQIVDYSTPTMYVVNKWNESEQSMTQYEFYSLNKAKDKVLELV